jgi:hypothetical protein
VSAEVTTREVLQELAAKPLGSPELQIEANRLVPGEKPAGELAETIHRTRKIWLASREAFHARQIDLEEAVEAAGGHRGAMGAR